MRLFLSYRRLDTAAIAGRIFDRLQSHFGSNSVFMDIDGIPFGADFRRYIRDTIAQTSVMLAVIGTKWLQPGEDGRSKLEDASDVVRIELEVALQCGITIIPVLVDNAAMPKPSQLPQHLKELAFLNAAEVDMGRDYQVHMDRLIAEIDRLAHSPRASQSAESRRKPIFPVKDRSSQPPANASAPPTLGRLARYTLVFWPRSVVGWIARIVFAWAFLGSVVFLTLTLQEGFQRDTGRSLSVLAPLALLSYWIALNDGRPRKGTH